MLDEEAQGHAAQQQEAAPKSGGAAASPQAQRMFETLARQALQMLTSEQSTEMLLAGVRAKPAEEVLGMAVAQVMQGALQAATAAGLQVPDDVINAAAQPAIKLLAAAMEDAGLVDDAAALADATMALVDEAVQGADQAQPAPEEVA